ncbi:hypothetical protein C5O19_11190 [Siphonobacter curvatus]|uniref:Uncharacterized protein n=2 Tax=Siphonobacter curvatus TaxID=2094562 RepID=A0A2S7IR08_9BACT|nr:hypothetical protein C5O19_11190 [Siphonobacter curvatus]
MTPTDLLSPAKKRQKEKYERVWSYYQKLIEQGAAKNTALERTADHFQISRNGTLLIVNTMKG